MKFSGPQTSPFKTAFLFLSMLVTFLGCNEPKEKDLKALTRPLHGRFSSYKKGSLTFSLKQKKISIDTVIAISEIQQAQGLSGVPPKDFGPLHGMLFYYSKPGNRSFWMPDTHFNLDIIFLDSNFKVVDIERDMMATPWKKEPPPIPRTRVIFAHHVLEIKADSPLSSRIQKGTQFNFSFDP